MKLKTKLTIALLAIISNIGLVKSQVSNMLNFRDYILLVQQKNLEYMAQKYNVPIAEAQIRTASMYPDPTIQPKGGNNGINKDMGYMVGGELAWTLELGKKRKARIDLATNQSELEKIQLSDFYRNLRADASLMYIDALKAKELKKVQNDSYLYMQKLAHSDSLRYKLGSISLVASKQSKLEASSLHNTVFQYESAEQQALTKLLVYTGDEKLEVKEIEGDFDQFNRNFVLEDLITNALNERADLLAAKQNIQVSKSLIDLEKANRKIDLGLVSDYWHNTTAKNIIAPSPAVNGVSVGVSIPLKFSNRRNSDLKVAELSSEQANLQYKQVEQTIRAEVTQAYQQYQATQKQLNIYQKGMLTDAKNILDGIIYGYQRGETSILEVLNAQRTYNDVRANYYQTLADNASALIELERSSAIWDIGF